MSHAEALPSRNPCLPFYNCALFYEVPRPSAMNGRSGTFSPASTADGSEWSGISRYNTTEISPLQTNNNRANLASPPISGSSNGRHGPMINGGSRRPGDAGNPSPPNSTGRSSYGNTNINVSEWQRRKTFMMEESLAQHYGILKRYLAQSLRDEKGNPKPNRARDKLLRLSSVQFQELSTDVYDELLRRQSAGGPQSNGPGQVPMFLLPKENFHPKRNQARQKLATLPPPRFRDLATDVFYELERRFPRFAGGDIERNGSPALSSVGPPSRERTPNGLRPGVPPGGFAPRKASLNTGLAIPSTTAPEQDFEKPTPKTFQSNTIVPNKGTLVEDDDDQTESEYRDSAAESKRDTQNTFQSTAGTDNRPPNHVDAERRIFELQQKVDELETTIRDRDSVIRDKDSAIQDKDSAIRDKDSAIRDKDSAIRDKDSVIRDKDSAIQDRDSAIQEKDSVIQEKDRELREREDALRGKELALDKMRETQLDQGKVKASDPVPDLLYLHLLTNSFQASNVEREQWAELQTALEDKLADAVGLHNNLKSELEKLRANHADTARELQYQKDLLIEQDDSGMNEWRIRFENLDKSHQALLVDLRQQQVVTSEVKQEAAVFLEEMRVLSAHSNQSCEREENLLSQVHKLEDQLKQWKTRYSRAKSQVQTLRNSSLGLSVHQPDMTQLGGFIEQDGMVNGLHVTRFQVAIDELLRTARGGEPSSVLAHVKSVAIAVRSISQDLGEIPSDGDGEIQKIVKLKAKISATTNNLITASKNFAISEGLSPVSLLDAAASHLTAAVVGLIHIVKIHPPLPLNGQHEDDDDSSFIAESPAYYGIDFGRSASRTESVYSAFNSPQPPPLNVKNSPAKHAYPARELPSRDGPPNGVQHGHSLSNASVGLGVQVHDELDDLKVPPPIPLPL